MPRFNRWARAGVSRQTPCLPLQAKAYQHVGPDRARKLQRMIGEEPAGETYKTPALGDCPAHSPAFAITLPSHSSQHPHSLCLCRHHCIITYITLRSPLHLSQLCDFPSLWSNDRATILAPFPPHPSPNWFPAVNHFHMLVMECGLGRAPPCIFCSRCGC